MILHGINLAEPSVRTGPSSKAACAHDRGETQYQGGGGGWGGEKSSEKPERLSHSLGDRAPCVPVFPPIRPGKADYSTPPPTPSPSLPLSLALSPCTRAPGFLSTGGRGRGKLVILGAALPRYLTCSFQHLEGKRRQASVGALVTFLSTPTIAPAFRLEYCCPSLGLERPLSPPLRPCLLGLSAWTTFSTRALLSRNRMFTVVCGKTKEMSKPHLLLS